MPAEFQLKTEVQTDTVSDSLSNEEYDEAHDPEREAYLRSCEGKYQYFYAPHSGTNSSGAHALIVREKGKIQQKDLIEAGLVETGLIMIVALMGLDAHR